MCTAQSYSEAAHSPNTAGLATKTDLSAADNVPQPTPPAAVQNNNIISMEYAARFYTPAADRHQQITLRATLIFHLIDGLLSTVAAHEVRRAGVLTCGSCHLERSARLHLHRG